ncbi:MAG: PAAR domain-containing protein [Candidatus Accumulibacter sp.]|jgi:uncharacterized Zn-binding protein involved in type VI secretion|nr:PAAR domain-containing protein [Accumulibacter sp.]
MAIIGFIVVGDRTSHGGEVMTGSPTRTIDGIPLARIGDKVWCPKCDRTTTIISSRFPTVTDRGIPAAYDQDVTDCGAVLHSRHNNHAGWGERDTTQAAQSCGKGFSVLRADLAGETATLCGEHFILVDRTTGEPVSGFAYALKADEGEYKGIVSADGATALYRSEGSVPVDLLYAVQLEAGIR